MVHPELCAQVASVIASEHRLIIALVVDKSLPVAAVKQPAPVEAPDDSGCDTRTYPLRR
jgi:hypothetical protein